MSSQPGKGFDCSFRKAAGYYKGYLDCSDSSSDLDCSTDSCSNYSYYCTDYYFAYSDYFDVLCY